MASANSESGAPAAYAPFETIDGASDSGVLFVCDHASNALPPEYGSLGLSQAQMSRHIAYDIGAADMTRALARRFNAPAVLSRFSRLLIDPNRGDDDPTLIMQLSDGAVVPGNRHVDSAEIERRLRLFWQPYRKALREKADAILAAGIVPAIVSLHSFTPIWKDVPRPWQVAVLWDSDPRLVVDLIAALRADPSLDVGDNEPYDGAQQGDTMYTEATKRGLPHALIEVRQDLIANRADAEAWAERLAAALAPILARSDLHKIERLRSRADSI